MQRVDVDDVTARQVNEQGAGLHQLELDFSDEVRVGFLAVHVHGDDVGFAQHGLHGGHLCGVAQGEALGGVVEDDVKAHGLGEDGELGADVAVADDAQSVPAHLVGAVRALVPHAAVQTGVFDGDAAREVDDLADCELDDGARVGVGGVEHGDAHLGGGSQVDLVCADAEGADGLEFGART